MTDAATIKGTKLDALLKGLEPLSVKGSRHVQLSGLAYDSRQVRPGFLFFALPGENRDGGEFLDDAVKRGAVAVVSEAERPGYRDVTQVCVRSAREAMARMAHAFYGDPSAALKMVGITGTNGKTTVSFMVRDLLTAAGLAPGLIGTIQYQMGERCIPATRTTPESLDLAAMLDQMVHAGSRGAVMEVSSHGLVQQRVLGIEYDVGVFTNLTRDHLDYHQTMESYFEAKALLFRSLGLGAKSATAVINADTEWGARLAVLPGLKAEVLAFGLEMEAQVRARDIHCSAGGSDFIADSPWGSERFHLNLLGRFNISNALAAASACGALGVPWKDCAEVLAAMKPVPGRLEQILNRKGLLVFVDYAHTDDALAHVLQTLREITARRLIVVFGCGGRRDRAKRPLMGAVAARLADFSIITSDNPRNEDPVEIVVQVASGFGFSETFVMEIDRRKAIARALAMAGEGDTVLIAGKGHENYQEFANTVAPFDDREVVRECLRNEEYGTSAPRGDGGVQ